LSKNSSWGLEGLCDRWVRELCMCTCHTNHSVGCIKEQLTIYSLLASLLSTITDVTLYLNHKFPVYFLLYIATKQTCQINQIITVNSSMNAPISETSQKKLFHALRAFVFICHVMSGSANCPLLVLRWNVSFRITHRSVQQNNIICSFQTTIVCLSGFK